MKKDYKKDGEGDAADAAKDADSAAEYVTRSSRVFRSKISYDVRISSRDPRLPE